MAALSPRRLLPVPLALLALSLDGCGLSDYEAKLAAEQKRLDRFDEEDQLLGDPLEMPPPKDSGHSNPLGTTETSVFIRPPLGTSAKFESATLGEFLHRYPRLTPSRFAAKQYKTRIPEAQDNPFLEVDLALVPQGDWNDFTLKVQQPFQAMPHAEQMTLVKLASARGPLEFWTIRFTDAGNPATSYFVYLTPKGKQPQVAVAYRVLKEKADSPEAAKTIDASLKSLVVGPEAATLRTRFAKRP